MMWYHTIAYCSLAICLGSCIYIFFRLIFLGKPQDFSTPKAKIGPGVGFAFTGAMNPKRKESAYLHLPTYFAGVLYHLGTFFSIFVFVLLLTGYEFSGLLSWAGAGFLAITGLCGIAIFLRRMIKKQIRALSNPDDYISNLLVTVFHLMSLAAIINPAWLPGYFVSVSLLMLYIPVGKLKHAVYFFAARYHLGFFYGRRGVWPPKKF